MTRPDWLKVASIALLMVSVLLGGWFQAAAWFTLTLVGLYAIQWLRGRP